jgi:hypothetical protein
MATAVRKTDAQCIALTLDVFTIEGMLHSVLAPGAVFLAITLGEPAMRAALLAQPHIGWSVSCLLLPRVPADQMLQAEPCRCVAQKGLLYVPNMVLSLCPTWG